MKVAKHFRYETQRLLKWFPIEAWGLPTKLLSLSKLWGSASQKSGCQISDSLLKNVYILTINFGVKKNSVKKRSRKFFPPEFIVIKKVIWKWEWIVKKFHQIASKLAQFVKISPEHLNTELSRKILRTELWNLCQMISLFPTGILNTK